MDVPDPALIRVCFPVSLCFQCRGFGGRSLLDLSPGQQLVLWSQPPTGTLVQRWRCFVHIQLGVGGLGWAGPSVPGPYPRFSGPMSQNLGGPGGTEPGTKRDRDQISEISLHCRVRSSIYYTHISTVPQGCCHSNHLVSLILLNLFMSPRQACVLRVVSVLRCVLCECPQEDVLSFQVLVLVLKFSDLFLQKLHLLSDRQHQVTLHQVLHTHTHKRS